MVRSLHCDSLTFACIWPLERSCLVMRVRCMQLTAVPIMPQLTVPQWLAVCCADSYNFTLRGTRRSIRVGFTLYEQLIAVFCVALSGGIVAVFVGIWRGRQTSIEGLGSVPSIAVHSSIQSVRTMCACDGSKCCSAQLVNSHTY